MWLVFHELLLLAFHYPVNMQPYSVRVSVLRALLNMGALFMNGEVTANNHHRSYLSKAFRMPESSL